MTSPPKNHKNQKNYKNRTNQVSRSTSRHPHQGFLLKPLVAALALAGGAAEVGATPQYVITDLGPAGGEIHTVAVGLNDVGQIVGYSYSAGGDHAAATLWNYNGGGYTATALPGLTGNRSYAADINNAAVVVGHATLAGESGTRATLWSSSNSYAGVTDLGTLGGIGSIAYDINDAGQVAGSSN